jgi:hypothetical protein
MIESWKVKNLDIVLCDETISISQGDKIIRLSKSELIGTFVVLQEIIISLRKQVKGDRDNNEKDRDSI